MYPTRRATHIHPPPKKKNIYIYAPSYISSPLLMHLPIYDPQFWCTFSTIPTFDAPSYLWSPLLMHLPIYDPHFWCTFLYLRSPLLMDLPIYDPHFWCTFLYLRSPLFISTLPIYHLRMATFFSIFRSRRTPLLGDIWNKIKFPLRISSWDVHMLSASLRVQVFQKKGI
jgi:hypothetical protein